jgi:hypothetical protein
VWVRGACRGGGLLEGQRQRVAEWERVGLLPRREEEVEAAEEAEEEWGDDQPLLRRRMLGLQQA